MTERVRYQVESQIATITLDRPEKRNAMSYAMLGEFNRAVERAGSDPEARAVIVTGSGGALCAGTDLSDLAGVPGEQRGGSAEAREKTGFWPLLDCPKPVIGAIDGAAVAMGAEFTSLCDVRIASSRARFGCSTRARSCPQRRRSRSATSRESSSPRRSPRPPGKRRERSWPAPRSCTD